MGRSIKKGPFIDGHLLEKIAKAKETKSKQEQDDGCGIDIRQQ